MKMKMMMERIVLLFVLLFQSILLASQSFASSKNNNNNNGGFASIPVPTSGFKQMAFNCEVQKPYNLPIPSRFEFDETTGIYHMWVFASDQPYLRGSHTLPRSELRVAGLDYTSGVWQFEGDFFVASTISGICIMQVFGGTNFTATAIQLHIVNGTLIRSGGGLPNEEIISGVCDRWVHLNVIHDANQGFIQVYVDKLLQYYEDNASYKTHYFKCGSAYTQAGYASPRLDSKWKNIAIWKKPAKMQEEVHLFANTASCFPQ